MPKIVCACSVCSLDIHEGTKMADLKVFKCGELSYIALAHYGCAIEENRKGVSPKWEHD